MKKVTVKVRKPRIGTDWRMSSAGTISSSALRFLAARVATVKVKSREAPSAANIRSVVSRAYSGNRAGSRVTGVVRSRASGLAHLARAAQRPAPRRRPAAGRRSGPPRRVRRQRAGNARARAIRADLRRGIPWLTSQAAAKDATGRAWRQALAGRPQRRVRSTAVAGHRTGFLSAACPPWRIAGGREMGRSLTPVKAGRAGPAIRRRADLSGQGKAGCLDKTRLGRRPGPAHIEAAGRVRARECESDSP